MQEQLQPLPTCGVDVSPNTHTKENIVRAGHNTPGPGLNLTSALTSGKSLFPPAGHNVTLSLVAAFTPRDNELVQRFCFYNVEARNDPQPWLEASLASWARWEIEATSGLNKYTCAFGA